MQQQTRFAPLLEDVQSYLYLLRRHGFLRYLSDLSEYNARRVVVIDGIVEALEEAASVSLPVLYDQIPVEDLREVSVASVQRLVKETIRNMKRSLLPLESNSPIAGVTSQAIQQWETALQALRANIPYAP